MATETTGILNPGFSASPPPSKSVLKEAVDAVLKSFAKHTQGYGGGMFIINHNETKTSTTYETNSMLNFRRLHFICKCLFFHLQNCLKQPHYYTIDYIYQHKNRCIDFIAFNRLFCLRKTINLKVQIVGFMHVSFEDRECFYFEAQASHFEFFPSN